LVALPVGDLRWLADQCTPAVDYSKFEKQKGIGARARTKELFAVALIAAGLSCPSPSALEAHKSSVRVAAEQRATSKAEKADRGTGSGQRLPARKVLAGDIGNAADAREAEADISDLPWTEEELADFPVERLRWICGRANGAAEASASTHHSVPVQVAGQARAAYKAIMANVVIEAQRGQFVPSRKEEAAYVARTGARKEGVITQKTIAAIDYRLATCASAGSTPLNAARYPGCQEQAKERQYYMPGWAGSLTSKKVKSNWWILSDCSSGIIQPSYPDFRIQCAMNSKSLYDEEYLDGLEWDGMNLPVFPGQDDHAFFKIDEAKIEALKLRASTTRMPPRIADAFEVLAEVDFHQKLCNAIGWNAEHNAQLSVAARMDAAVDVVVASCNHHNVAEDGVGGAAAAGAHDQGVVGGSRDRARARRQQRPHADVIATCADLLSMSRLVQAKLREACGALIKKASFVKRIELTTVQSSKYYQLSEEAAAFKANQPVPSPLLFRALSAAAQCSIVVVVEPLLDDSIDANLDQTCYASVYHCNGAADAESGEERDAVTIRLHWNEGNGTVTEWKGGVAAGLYAVHADAEDE